MAKKRTQKTGRSRPVTPESLREHVRQVSVSAFRDGQFSLKDVSSLVHQVLDGAVQSVDHSIPGSSKNVLRQVFDGLGEGVRAAAAAGSDTARETSERVRRTMNDDGPAAAKRVREANKDFLSAVRDFADRATTQVREELDSMVDRAEKTTPKVTEAARHAAESAQGRWGELSEESAKAGVRMAGRAFDAMAAGAAGFFDGLAEAAGSRRSEKAAPLAPRAKAKPSTRKRASKPPARKKKAAKRAAKKK